MNAFLPYDPGVLPTFKAPNPGEMFELTIAGFPPAKSRRHSIRNRTHPLFHSFVALRKAATTAMAGRAWSFRPVELHLVVRSPDEMNFYGLNDYLGGIMDTLDGSSGYTFTYLPIAFEDDSQVTGCTMNWQYASGIDYSLKVVFL